jgi:DNA-binding winged helix-turn-helix (wHTH) protein/tetratricopeptide (TPR) repeat protein/TolB-like protein
MSMKAGDIFQFGKFQIDARARTLRREATVVALNYRAFDVLLYLVQNPGKALTRDELLKNVWHDTFVDEHNLAQSISVLRKALEEKPGDNNYIVTLPGRGYQFVSPVQVIAPDGLVVVPEAGPIAGHGSPVQGSTLPGSTGVLIQQQTIRTSVVTTEEKHPLSLPAPRRRVETILVAILVVPALAVAGYYLWAQSHRVQPSADSAAARPVVSLPLRRSVAVLGFRNLSRRPEEGWLSTALAEMLSTELEAGEKLRLVSGEDVARTKLDLPLVDTDSLSRDTLSRLHKDLNSDLIVLGSYTALDEKSGTRIRLDLHLQDTVAGETVADVAVVGGEADLFDMVTQAGSQLREKLGVEAVSPVDAVSIRGALPSNRDAARLYSEGLARLRVFDALDARDLLQRAITADPKYSLAHSALAEAWSRLGYDKKARQEAQQAFDLSTNLSREDKLAVEGRYRDIDHQYPKAIDVYRALFTLFPDNVDYGLKLADVQARGHKGDDALATVESLRKLPPPASEDPRIELAESTGWRVLGDFKHQEPPLARAVEKARAQGARLILAKALEDQARLFLANFTGRAQDAIALCRESQDISAAAGDRQGEGRALLVSADILSNSGDLPGAIHSYQQAQVIFQKIGSEGGLASVLNNLAVAYDREGDLANAEKMHRQAQATFRLLDDNARLAVVTSNVAKDRMEQGDLPGAIHLYQEQLQLGDPSNTENAALAGYGIAYALQLQGDLAGARQGFERSLALWQEKSNRNAAAYALWSLGSVLLEQADFAGSRKMYEQALAIRTIGGDTLAIAETQMGLADLSLEEARSPAEQEVAARKALEAFQAQKDRDGESGAWCMLARALLAQGKAAPAKDAVQHARSLAAKSQSPGMRWQAAITAAEVETADSDPAHSAAANATRQELTAILAKSRELGFVGVELDARLALAKLEMKTGQAAAGRTHLAAIEADAKAKGYNLIARKAATARG